MLKNWPKFTLSRNDEPVRVNPDHVVAVSTSEKSTIIYTTGAYQGIPFKVTESVDYVLGELGVAD